MKRTSICIYCQRDLPLEEFNREHVIPLSFGAFEENLVLDEIVCEDCNSYFGQHLEPFYGRDSLEGIIRYRFGIAENPQLKSGERFRPRRITFAVADESPWKGTLLELKEFGDRGQMIVDLIPQVSFKKKGSSEKKNFPIDWIPKKEVLEKEGFDISRVGILGQDDAERQRIIESLKSLGYTYNPKKWEKGPPYPEYDPHHPVMVDFRGKIDWIIKRTIAKIAFNYLAWIQKKNGNPTFVLSNDFDPVRNFIRNGDVPEWNILEYESEPLIRNDTAGRSPVPRHAIVIEWNPSHAWIVSRLSIFNIFSYRARLCKRYNGIYREIKSGHTFDAQSRKIQGLVGIDKRIAIVTF